MTLKFKCNEHHNAVLALSDGTYFLGSGIGKPNTQVVGEICFNTAMTGYQEILTDPSYCGQIITFTTPHIGNVGCNKNDTESKRAYCNGVVLRERITRPSSYRSENHFDVWLKEQNLTGICDVDTREITASLRNNGVKGVAIYHGSVGEEIDINALVDDASRAGTLDGVELTRDVSTKEPYYFTGGKFNVHTNDYETHAEFDYKIVVVDFGVKTNILRCLTDVGLKPLVVPSTISAAKLMSFKPDGIFLSNGPGDPDETSRYVAPLLQELLSKDVPIFGICMGHQLLSIACGLTTMKMHQGHRGANQPVKRLCDGAVEITSQNHGFCVSDHNLPPQVEITHLSLFDKTVEGMRLKHKPVFSVQYHPESSPGPHDSRYLFETFKELIRKYKNNGQK